MPTFRPAPHLPSFLLVFLIVSTQSQQLLKLTNNIATTNLTIPVNETVTNQIDLPSGKKATLRLEWTTENITAYPSTILYATEETLYSPLRDTGNSLDYFPDALNYTCTRANPCSNVSTIDFVSFHTRANASFLQIPFTTSLSRIYVTVFNYDDGVTNSEDPIASLPPPQKLTGVLSARVVETNGSEDCPGGMFPTDPVCGDRGTCVDSHCKCNPSFLGRACERNIVQLPEVNKPPEPPSDTDFLRDPLVETPSFSITVGMFSDIVFEMKQAKPHQRLQLILVILQFKPELTEKERLRVPFLFSSSPPGFKDPLRQDNLTLPSFGVRGDFEALQISDATIVITFKEIKVKEKLYMAFYSIAREDITAGSVLIQVNQTACNIDECEVRAGSLSLELALVPAFLVTTIVAAVGVLVMLWIDRRHGFTRNIDRLSTAEIDRMYPKTDYSGQTLECSICLCEMEHGDAVRKLRCDHIYHSECLDPWLTDNRASCPTCRTDLRVEHLSDRRHMRRTVQFFLAPIVLLRRLQERRRDARRDLVDDPPPDLETGNTGQTLAPTPRDGGNDDTANTRENE